MADLTECLTKYVFDLSSGTIKPPVFKHADKDYEDKFSTLYSNEDLLIPYKSAPNSNAKVNYEMVAYAKFIPQEIVDSYHGSHKVGANLNINVSERPRTDFIVSQVVAYKNLHRYVYSTIISSWLNRNKSFDTIDIDKLNRISESPLFNVLSARVDQLDPSENVMVWPVMQCQLHTILPLGGNTMYDSPARLTIRKGGVINTSLSKTLYIEFHNKTLCLFSDEVMEEISKVATQTLPIISANILMMNQILEIAKNRVT